MRILTNIKILLLFLILVSCSGKNPSSPTYKLSESNINRNDPLLSNGIMMWDGMLFDYQNFEFQTYRDYVIYDTIPALPIHDIVVYKTFGTDANVFFGKVVGYWSGYKEVQGDSTVIMIRLLANTQGLRDSIGVMNHGDAIYYFNVAADPNIPIEQRREKVRKYIETKKVTMKKGNITEFIAGRKSL